MLRAENGEGVLGGGSEPSPHQVVGLGSAVSSPSGAPEKKLNLVNL